MAHAKKKGVKKQDLILIAVTFVMGIIAGWYLYVMAFAPQFNEFLGQTESVYEDLVLVGEEYRAEADGTLPSFQILKDGTFSYVPATALGDVATPMEGTLPRALWNEVKADLTKARLVKLDTVVVGEGCASANFGADFTYTVTLSSVEYTLDTCTTALSADTAVRTTLDKLWKYFATLP